MVGGRQLDNKKCYPIILVLLFLTGIFVAKNAYTLSSLPNEGVEDIKLMEISLNQTVTATFNATYREEYYILEITDPGVYFLNMTANLTRGNWVDGRCSIYSSGKVYSPFCDRNISTKDEIDYESFYMEYPGETDSMHRVYVFINTGTLMIDMHWSLYEEDTVEVEFTIEKQTSLRDIKMLNIGLNSFNWTEEEETKIYGFNVKKAGVYNITLNAQLHYNISDPSKLIKSATLTIYTDGIDPNENLTVYLNNFSIGTITEDSYFTLDVDPSYVVLNGENNLTLVYNGSDGVYVYDAELRIVNIFGDSWETWFDIDSYITDVYSSLEWFSYSLNIEPFSSILLFDKEHGVHYYMGYYVEFYLGSWIYPPDAGILNLTSGRTLYLFPETYYFSVTSSKFKAFNASYVLLNITVEKIDVPVLSGEASTFLEFNLSNLQPQFAVVQLSPDKYHELSISVTDGGNVSVQAYVQPVGLWQYSYGYDPMLTYLTVNYPAENMSYEEKTDWKNMVEISLPFYYGLFYGWYLTGSTYFKEPISFIFGERLFYRNGTPETLLQTEPLFTSAGLVFLYVYVEPEYYWNGYSLTPSENVTVKLSLNVTGDVETITPGSTITFNTNTTVGPVYRVFKLDTECGSVYTINATPLEYVRRGYVEIVVLPSSIENWYLWYSYYYYYYGPYAEAVNTSAVLHCPSVFDSPVYILVTVTEYFGSEVNGTSRVALSVDEAKPAIYSFGTVEKVSLESFKVYQFDIIENYTYVITVKPEYEYDLTSGKITIIDSEGNCPFRGSSGMYATTIVPQTYDNVSYYFIADRNATVYLIFEGEGTVSFEVSFIKPYEVGFEEGYQAGFEAGNETGFNEGNSTGFEEGYQAGSSKGYNAGRNFGLLVAGPSGLFIGAMVVYIILRRRT